MKKSFLIKFKDYFLEIIFPIYCLSCHKEGKWICRDCFNKISIETEYTCPRCHKKTNKGEFCPECEITSKMKGLIIASSYENKLLQKIISTFKYKYITDLRYPLAEVLFKSLKYWNTNDFNDYYFIPIPLHKKKFKKRGFNQSALLAQAISKKLSANYQGDIVRRIKNTSAQAKLSPIKRRKNIKDAFRINSDLPKNFLADKKIILVDDVCTTSSTLEECAKEIDKLNPEEIWGLVLARGK